MSWWSFKPYVSAAERRAKAARTAARLSKKGRKLSPVKIEGRAIATTFWGKAWCNNLESYSDYENRLPRGRTYARNGSVLDLQIGAGRIKALVSGSDLYNVTIEIAAHPAAAWKELKTRCAGQIGSLVELLQGKLSKGVMDLVSERDGGLFPKPKEIKIHCSCPDWAGLCKHAAAVLYGVGARFDQEPELLFKLRKLDHLELISEAGSSAAFASSKGKKVLAENELSDVFGIEFAEKGSQSAPDASFAAGAAPIMSRRRKSPIAAAPHVHPKERPSRRLRKPAAVVDSTVVKEKQSPPRKARKKTLSTKRPRTAQPK
jgi:uncharacterized Zn finger protein